MSHRRLTIPAALVGAACIALAPAFAEASTASHAATTHSTTVLSSSTAKAVTAAAAKAKGYRTFSSPASHSKLVTHKAATASAATDPNPDLAVAINGGVTSARGVELILSITGYTTTTTDGLSVTVDWGDGESSTGSNTGTTPAYTHEYSSLGTYTITVTVTDNEGDTVTNSIAGATTWGSEYTAYGPVRILDTRTGLGESSAAAVAADGTLKLQVTGAGTTGDTIPTGITAVALNVTAVSPTANGVLTVYGDQDVEGDTLSNPGTSNLNFRTGQNVPNLVIVPVGANGVVDIYNGSKGKTQVLADVAGYFTSTNTDKYVAISPARILDTRKGIGTGGTVAQIPAKGSVTLTVAGSDSGTIPSTGVSAVAMNLTAVGGTKNGVITAFPTGESTPTVSNLNYSTGQTIANMSIVPVSSSGQVTFYNNSSGSVDLLADADGYYSSTTTVSTASAYVAQAEPIRILDTRSADSLIQLAGPLKTGTIYDVPFGAESYETGEVFNATVVSGTGNGFVSLYPFDPSSPTALPSTSNLNYMTNETVPNLAITTLGTTADSDGLYDLGIYLGGSGNAQLILDWFGEFQDQ